MMLLKALVGWILILCQIKSSFHTVVSGQTLSPFKFLVQENIIPIGGDDDFSSANLPALRSFLEPCDIHTLQASCTLEEYESDEDCLPQKTDNCDHSKELFCLSGVCLPNCHPSKETYDHVQGKCFRKVGSDCKIQNSTISISSTPPISTVPSPPCEKFAVCERGQCRCAKGSSYDLSFNKCVSYSAFNQFCNESLSCDVKSDIQCKENQCQCKSPETQYFHLKRKRCYISIGGVCSSGLQFCPDNSLCLRSRLGSGSKSNSSGIQGESGHPILRKLLEESLERENLEEDEHFIGILGEEGEDERDFMCKCDKDYGPTSDKRFCLGLHGSRCNTLLRCNSDRGLKCYDGSFICRREKENEQAYSDLFKTCITLPGFPCNETEGGICPIGGSCREGMCSCDEGLTPATPHNLTDIDKDKWSAAHSCLKPHGTSCHPQEEDDPFTIQCNNQIGLECNKMEGKCLCQRSDQYYDVKLARCRNFQEVQGKIPVVHFTPPEDREYNFRSAGRNRSSKSLAINFTFPLLIILLTRIITYSL